MLGFFRRTVDLKDHLRQTKKIRIKGVNFEIKKVGMNDHLAGLNVILKTRELYKREKPTDPAVILEDESKVKKFMRDFIYAGVVAPKLTMKEPVDDGAIHVDELLTDIDLCQELTVAIIEHSYGKKKLSAST